MQRNELTAMLKGLRLRGMMQAMEELAVQNSPAFQAATPIIEGLLKAEAAERDVRSLAYQMKAARPRWPGKIPHPWPGQNPPPPDRLALLQPVAGEQSRWQDVTLPLRPSKGSMEGERLETKQTNHSRHAAGNRHQPARDRATDRGGPQNHPPPGTGRNRAGTQLPCRGHRAGGGKFLHPGHRLASWNSSTPATGNRERTTIAV